MEVWEKAATNISNESNEAVMASNRGPNGRRRFGESIGGDRDCLGTYTQVNTDDGVTDVRVRNAHQKKSWFT